MIYIYFYKSPLGLMTLSSDGENLTGLGFDRQKHFDASLLSECIQKKLPIFTDTIRWLDIYFSGKNPAFTIPTSFCGKPFQLLVWERLKKIPYGETVTYGEIAGEIASQKGIARMSAQAVGGAVGKNPISIIIPCHRVIGANGKLTGYAGGIDRKLALLKLENPLFCKD